MRVTSLLLLAAIAPLAAGCTHAWPPEARGGMAERLGDTPADLAASAQATDNALSAGSIGPARAAIIREQLTLAERERDAGLEADSDTNALAASLALGGADITSPSGRRTCMKAPCF